MPNSNESTPTMNDEDESVKGLVKIQVYVSPRDLELVLAIAKLQNKQPGALHRKLWEIGLVQNSRDFMDTEACREQVLKK